LTVTKKRTVKFFILCAYLPSLKRFLYNIKVRFNDLVFNFYLVQIWYAQHKRRRCCIKIARLI